MKAEAALATGANAAEVVEALFAQLPMLDGVTEVDLAFLFTSDAYAADLPAILPDLKARTGARVVVGCSGQGLIGPAKEEEQEPAMSLQVLSLPGATLTPFYLRAEEALSPDAGDLIRVRLGEGFLDANAMFLFVDPFSVDGERLLESIAFVRDDLPLVGGLASSK
jgi:small ligand-binding sensory domain FIST